MPRRPRVWGNLNDPLEAEKHREQHREDLALHDTEMPPRRATVRTTDATVTTLAAMELANNATTLVDALVVARRTGGTSGAAGDSATYRLVGLFYRDAGGAATQVGTTTVSVSIESVAAYNCVLDVTGNDVRVRITGVATTNITWVAVIKLIEVSR